MPSPRLSYRITPPSAFPDTTISLNLTIGNDGATDIIFSTSDRISFNIPSGVVRDYDFSASAPSGSGFSIAQDTTEAGTFAIKCPFQGVTIRPGSQLTFVFSAVPIASDPIDAKLTITESLGEGDTTVELDFTIQPPGLGVVAWLDELIIAQFDSTRLNWVSSGANRVIISGFSGAGDKEVALSGSIDVYIPDQDSQQWTYTVSVYSGSDLVDQAVTLQQNPPILHSFTRDPADAVVAVDQPVTLEWSTQYASSVFLTRPNIPNERYRIPADPVTVTPGADMMEVYRNGWSQMPSVARYFVTANGFERAAVGEVDIQLAPVKLLYFKYRSSDSTTIMYKTAPDSWTGIDIQNSPDTNIYRLTLYQPGGVADVYYLGSDDTIHPQITSFSFVEAADGTFSISWTTANCAKLVLTPGNIAIPEADIDQSGRANLQADTYQLTGTATDGSEITSTLVVG
jgi:hypothetical protein